jgi:hypothetical protein
MANTLPLIESASGLTSVVTWTINIREDWEFVDAYPPSPALGWARCIFPKLIEERFRMNPSGLAGLRARANILD